MRLFGGKAAEPAPAQGVGRLGPGRKLRSDSDVARCRETLDAIVDTYRPRKYAELPHVVDSGYEWYGEGRPAYVVSLTDDRDDYLLVTLCGSMSGSEIGIFPLGSDDQSMMMPLPGHWKMRDSSLASIGRYPGGTVSLREPPIPDDYVKGTLAKAGVPVTPPNVIALQNMMAQQFVVKAYQFISSQQPAFADTFAARHRDSTDLRAILRDLAAWNPGVLPYIQDLPMRVRALLLERETFESSPLWAGMQR